MAYRRKKYTTRRRAGGRKYGGRRRGGGFSNNDVVKQLTVVANPHSTMTSTPKIPDGALTTSLGWRIHAFKEQAFATAKMHIALFPALGQGCLMFNSTGATGYTITTTDLEGLPIQWPTTISLKETLIKPKLERWRIVSQGVNIKCTNSEDMDSGSFIARRAPVPLGPAYWGGVHTKLATGDTAQYFAGLVPKGDAWVSYFNEASAPNNVSFCSGRLKDLGKHYFQLQDVSPGGHPMVEVDNNVRAATSATNWSTTGVDALDAAVSLVERNRGCVEQLVDSKMDCIFITMSGVITDTTIAVDCVANVEFIPDPTDPRATLASECANGYSQWKSTQNKLRYKNRKACKQ